MLWVRTPEAPPSLAVAAVVVLPSPQGTAGRLLHNRSISGLLLPFTGVPAYVLPVYASSDTLPYTTQDSVPDCSLGVVRAAIADGWTVCACKAQTGSPAVVTHRRLPQNVACGFPALRSSNDDSQHCVLLQPCLGHAELRTRNAAILSRPVDMTGVFLSLDRGPLPPFA